MKMIKPAKTSGGREEGGWVIGNAVNLDIIVITIVLTIVTIVVIVIIINIIIIVIIKFYTFA